MKRQMTNGEAWLKLSDAPTGELKRVAALPGWHLEEEMARAILRGRLVFERVARTLNDAG